MTNGNNKRGSHEGDARITALRQFIQHSFPAETYEGKVTPVDGAWTPELDDDEALYEALHGRKWTDVPKKILYNLPDGYVLLTEEAFVAFLPAWLICSLENIEGENEVRNFVVYAFSPKHDMVPDTTEFIVKRLRLLTAEQLRLLRSLLREFAERATSTHIKKLATDAVTLIESLGR